MRESNTGRSVVWKAGRFTWDLSEKGLIMGILNVTPDSFSDGGSFHKEAAAIRHAHVMAGAGADILDIGGESTRPGSLPISVDEELSRTISIIERLRAEVEIAISIDTSKVEVASAAIEAGADIINDVTGFRDPKMRALCVDSSCGLVAMHMQGTPQIMQDSPVYQDVLSEVGNYFTELSNELVSLGVDPDRIVFDPGIGFGKSLEHNLSLLGGLRELQRLGRPLLMGVSRKSLIASLLNQPDLQAREYPTVALTAFTRIHGAMIHRVHSVGPNVEALRMIESLVS